PLLGFTDRGPATLWGVRAELRGNRGGAALLASAAAAFHHPHSVAPRTGRAPRPSRPHRAHGGRLSADRRASYSPGDELLPGASACSRACDPRQPRGPGPAALPVAGARTARR